MKTAHQIVNPLESRNLVLPVLLALLSACFFNAADNKIFADTPSGALQTNKDVPADFHKYFGQRINSWRDRERSIAKLDMDADMNQDGMIQNNDPADSGAFEATPPGLILGTGELTRVVIRLIPYRVDFDGEAVLTLEVEGINRGDKTGEYASLNEELASMGHIRVWRDREKKNLLLDSRDPAKRIAEFSTQYKTYPYNLPIAVPRYVFVEGVKPSPNFIGDIRLLVTISHRSPKESAKESAKRAELTSAKTPVETEPDPKTISIKSFRTSFDHILFTVQNDPVPKQFVNNNNEGVWLAPPGKSYTNQ